jgi:hypothetical protein
MKIPLRVFTFAGLVFIVGSLPTPAKEKPHLPTEILKAKTVVIDYRLGPWNEAKFLYLTKEAIQKWGRFQIVTPRDHPDLALVFDATSGDLFTLTVMDGSYHRALWLFESTSEPIVPRPPEWGPYTTRGADLVGLLRKQVEAEEHTPGKPIPKTKKGD